MKDFLLILFFSKTLLLTPSTVKIFGEYVLVPESTLTAITSGASIQIDITKFSSLINVKEKGIIETRKYLTSVIPKGSVLATLYSKNISVTLANQNFSISNDNAYLMLSSKQGIPVGVEFDKVVITSKVPLSGVKIYWRNYTK